MTNFQKVKTFMETFGQEVKTKPSFASQKINDLRYDLIKEFIYILVLTNLTGVKWLTFKK